MSSKTSDSSVCSCLSDDASIVDYSEAEHILQDVKADLKSIQNEIKTTLSQSCSPDHTSRACKVSALLVKLQNVDSRLHHIINLTESKNHQEVDDLVSNFGMSVKLDIARNKLNGLKAKHADLSREWHSQEAHLNRIAKEVAKKEDELKYQSVFCTTQGYVLSKMLWKSSKCDCLLESMVSEEKLILELVKTLDGSLYAFTKTYQNEMPDPAADEYQYVLCLCGVLSNLASIPDGRFFLISQPVCRDVYDQIIKALPKILVPKAEDLKWILLVAIYNIMICKEGREYAKNNRFLLQSLSECIRPPHSNKIIILTLKIIGNLTNDPNKAYVAHVSSILPRGRLSELEQSQDSCTIRKQAKQILSSMETEALIHTIQLEHSKSRCNCNSAGTQTGSRRNHQVLAYYVFTDTTPRTSEYTSPVSSTSTSWTESEDHSRYDRPISHESEFEMSESFLYSKFSQKPQASSAPVSSHERKALECKVKSVSAYNAKRSSTRVSPLPIALSYMEDQRSDLPSLPTARIYMEARSKTVSRVPQQLVYRENLQEPMSGLSFLSSYSSRECQDRPLHISTTTPAATYVDSRMLSALSSSHRTVTPPSQSSPHTSALVSTVTPVATYVNSTMFPVSIASSYTGTTNQLQETVSQFGNTKAQPLISLATYVDSMMLPELLSPSNRVTTKELTNPTSQSSYVVPSSTRKVEGTTAAHESASFNSSPFVSSSKRIKSNLPVNVRFNERSSTLCHPSVWSMPSKPISTSQEPTPSRSEEIFNLQRQFPYLDINQLLSITIGDNLQNPSHPRRNIGNNTFTDGQSNPSMITVFRISKSKTLLSPDQSSALSHNSISTNTSFPWGVAVEDFFRIKNKNIGTSSKSSRRHCTTESQNTESFDIAYGGYEAYYEKLQKVSVMSKSTDAEKPHPQFHYDDINMPSTSTGYYGYEIFGPLAMYPGPNVSSASIMEREKENQSPEIALTDTDQGASCSEPRGTLGKMPEPPKSKMCSPSQSYWQCHASRGRTKPKKRPFYRIFDFRRKKKH